MTYNIRLVDANTTTTISTPISHAEVLFSDLDGIVDRPGLSDFAGIPSSDYTKVSLDVTTKLTIRNDIVSGYDVAIFDDGAFGLVNEGESNAVQSLYMVRYDLHDFTSFDVVNGYLTFDTDTEAIGGYDYSRHVEMDMNADYELITPVFASLPVELLYFNAKKDQTNVVLKWATAQELNNSHFEVEYSLNGIHFTPVTRVLGRGTSNETSMYQTIHRNAKEWANPFIYYRLKQVDFAGSYEYSEMVSVGFQNEIESAISIYPNPVVAGSTLFLSFSNEKIAENDLISLYNGVGKKVLDYSYNGSDGIAIPAGLQAGPYTLSIYDISHQQYFREKIIIRY